MPDVFLSYSRKDGEVAEELRRVLELEGISCWKDDRNIVASSDYFEAISENIRTCRAVVFLASRHSNQSDWCKRELAVARDDYAKPVIPVRLDNSPLPRVWLGNVQAVELYQPTDALFQALSAANVRFDAGPLLLAARKQRRYRKWLSACTLLLFAAAVGFTSVRLSQYQPTSESHEARVHAKVSPMLHAILVATRNLEDAEAMFIDRGALSDTHRRHQIKAMNEYIAAYNALLKGIDETIEHFRDEARSLDPMVEEAHERALRAIDTAKADSFPETELPAEAMEKLRQEWVINSKNLGNTARLLERNIKQFDAIILNHVLANSQAAKPLLRCDVQGLVGTSRAGRQ